jgi:hypothetical protein
MPDRKQEPKRGDVVICETVAAITTHYRVLSERHPRRLSGHATPRPLALCGTAAAWDTELPTHRQDGSLAARCSECLAMATKAGL